MRAFHAATLATSAQKGEAFPGGCAAAAVAGQKRLEQRTNQTHLQRPRTRRRAAQRAFRMRMAEISQCFPHRASGSTRRDCERLRRPRPTSEEHSNRVRNRQGGWVFPRQRLSWKRFHGGPFDSSFATEVTQLYLLVRGSPNPRNLLHRGS